MLGTPIFVHVMSYLHEASLDTTTLPFPSHVTPLNYLAHPIPHLYPRRDSDDMPSVKVAHDNGQHPAIKKYKHTLRKSPYFVSLIFLLIATVLTVLNIYVRISAVPRHA